MEKGGGVEDRHERGWRGRGWREGELIEDRHVRGWRDRGQI